jgi:chaperonin cofactor prefoldin
MALGPAEVEEFLATLHAHPELRERVRSEMVSADLAALPGIIRELAEAQRRTEARVEELAEAQRRTEARVEELTSTVGELAEAQKRTEATVAQLVASQERLELRVDRLAQEVSALAGRTGNLEGEVYEFRWMRNAASKLGAYVRRARIISLPDIPELDDAFHNGRLPRSEWDELVALDAIVAGADRQTGVEPSYAAIELSKTLDANDISRAARRAGIMAAHGVPARAVAGGRQISRDAAELAERLAVTVIVETAEVAA